MNPPMGRESGPESVFVRVGGMYEPCESSCEGKGGMRSDRKGAISGMPGGALFQEGEEDGEDEAGESDEVVPVDGLPFEDEEDDNREDREGNDLLDDLELDEIERTAVLGVADAVGGYGQAVLEERYSPGKQDDQDERPSGGDLHFTQFEMPVPCERHENVRADEHEYCPDTLMHIAILLISGRKFTSFL